MNNVILKIFLFLIICFPVNSEIKVKPIIDGNSDAKVNIVIFESLTCGHCADFHKNIFPKLKKQKAARERAASSFNVVLLAAQSCSSTLPNCYWLVCLPLQAEILRIRRWNFFLRISKCFFAPSITVDKQCSAQGPAALIIIFAETVCWVPFNESRRLISQLSPDGLGLALVHSELVKIVAPRILASIAFSTTISAGFPPFFQKETFSAIFPTPQRTFNHS